MNDTFILAAKRTPIGSFQGMLSKLTATSLGAHAIKSITLDLAIDSGRIDEVYMGNVVSAGLRQAPARQAMREAGLDDATPATTVNKVCGSGMKATMIGHDSVKLGNASCIVVGGMESMTNMPHLLPRVRRGYRLGHREVLDSMFTDGLEDAETKKTMGDYAQLTADEYQVTRESMDEFAINSLTKARLAMDSKNLAHEITPINDLHEDEQPRKSDVAAISRLRPAFRKDGTITAASTSSISDGASALLLANQSIVESENREPLCRIVAHASIALAPQKFVLAPIHAIQTLLKQTGWKLDSVDLFEINEAFAVVTMLAIDHLKLDPNKVNIYGGSCAQGHPLGSTGSRLIVTLAHALRVNNLRRGIAALCIGGGEGTAIALERD